MAPSSSASLGGTLSDTPSNQSPNGSGRERDSWSDTAAEISKDPKRAIPYLLCLAVIVAVAVRFELPGEFWAIFGGVVSGGVARAKKD